MSIYQLYLKSYIQYYATTVMKSHLKKIWNGWKQIAHKIARFQTIILITIFYFLIMVPMGVISRLFGWDPLESKGFDSKKTSNWKDVVRKSPDLDSLKRQS